MLGHQTPQGLQKWLLTVAIIVFTTVHTQDMPDQAGDLQRGRMSLPLQIGDMPARWTILVMMIIWGIFCPFFWECGWLGYLISTPLSFTVAYRTVAFRMVIDDKFTFKIWNAWMVSLYFLPLIQRIEVVNGDYMVAS